MTGALGCRVIDGAAAREHAILARASRQHGVVTRRELRSLGLSTREIDLRVKRHRLRPLHRGVYLAGPVAPPLAHEMAAVLACGRGAVASHRSAGVVWRLLREPARPGEVDVTVVARNPGPKPGIRLHRVQALDRRDVRTHRGIPVTSPARTLLDLATQLRPAELEQALAEALARRIVGRRDLVSLIARCSGRPGTRELRALLHPERSPALTRSQAERRMLELVRKARLPAPDTNVRLGAYEVDSVWRAERVVVEVDGFQFHSSRAAFERDRARDAELQAAGYRVLRVTWRQLLDEPEAVLARLARVLTSRNYA